MMNIDMINIGTWLVYLLCWVVLGVFVWLVARHRTILLGFTLMAAFSIALTNLSALFITKTFLLDEFFLTGERVEAGLLTLAGLLMFAAGVWIAWRPLRRNQPVVNPFVGYPANVVLFLVIGIGAVVVTPFIYKIPTLGAITAQSGLLIQLALLSSLVLAIYRTNVRILLLICFAYALVGMAMVVVSGFAGLLGNFLLHAMFLFLFLKQLRLSRVLLFAAGLFVYFALASVWMQKRSLIREEQLTSTTLVGRMAEFYASFGSSLNESLIRPETLQQVALDRIDMSQLNALQISWMPEGEPYSMGRSLFIDPLYALVPRVLWPEKTITQGDTQFINRYTGLQLSNETISVDTNITFELYANFGWAGIVFGLGVFGWVVARLELALFRPGKAMWQVLMISLVLFSFSTGGRRAAAMMLEIGGSVVGAYLIGLGFGLLNKLRGKLPLLDAAAEPSVPSLPSLPPGLSAKRRRP